MAAAQVVHQELQETVRAEVVAITGESTRPITGTDAVALVQDVTAIVQSGLRAGDEVEFINDIVPLSEGDRIFLNRLETIDGNEYYQFKDFDRRWQLVLLGLVFVGMLLWFAGQQGGRALLSLVVSVAAIIFLLIPALLAGYPPAATSVVIAALILAVVLFGTHGMNARSVIAFCGTAAAVVVTYGIATLTVSSMRLTGFGSDASIYLNFSTGGQLDFAGLLLGSIVIGILGVLDDVSITQASVVQELKAANPAFGLRDLYRSAIRVGRDHVGSLVNTLALAYVGVSLPLVLLFARTDAALGMIVNQEVVAAELVRIIVGSMGLVLAVPLTTLAAAWWYADRVPTTTDGAHGHHHHH